MSSRRDFLGIAGGVAAGVLLPAAAADAKQPPRTRRTGVAVGAHKVLPLPFGPDRLAGISAAMITSHHANNYAGAVGNLNKVELELARVTKDTPGFLVSSLRERELTYTNSRILHELYFANLGGNGKRGRLDARLAAAFGSAARWEELFRATALSLGGGSGWVVLDLDYSTGDLRIYGTSGHSQALALGQPVLVLDMFEHAYHLDFGAAHAKYVDAFFANVQWEEVARRLERGDRALAVLRP
jgi:superoxide dismutase, Fe-Mn family